MNLFRMMLYVVFINYNFLNCTKDLNKNISAAYQNVIIQFRNSKEPLKNSVFKAYEFFKNQKINEKSLVIFDIDGTIIDTYSKTAIWETFILYHVLLNLGYKIIFLTAAITNNSKIIEDKLIVNSFKGYEKIIFLTSKEATDIETKDGYLNDEAIALWKESKRCMLVEEGWNIAGVVEDESINLKGKNIGYPLLIRQYPIKTNSLVCKIL